MEKILNVTNGDASAQVLRRASVPGKILAWRDVLHDGPVPHVATGQELNRVRAAFIAGCGWGEYSQVLESFMLRDEILAGSNSFEKTILWFEHDLYDQLQLLQILSRLSGSKRKSEDVRLICTDQYLGTLTPEAMRRLSTFEMPLTSTHLALGASLWAAFCDNSPQSLQQFFEGDTSLLPFMHDAILRLFEEYPSSANGLSRTEQQALEIVAAGVHQPVKIFSLNQQCEKRIFLGDTGFFLKLKNLINTHSPLLQLKNGDNPETPDWQRCNLSLTDLGLQVLEGRKHWLDIAGRSWWIGGVHLTPGNRWCWDSRRQEMYRYHR